MQSSGLPDLSTVDIGDTLPRRPAFGTRGKAVTLWTNYFELIPPPNLLLYRYDVKIWQPTKKGPTLLQGGKKLGQVFRLLLDLPQFQKHRNDIVTDFKAFLISRVKLEGGNAEPWEFQIKYRAEGEDEPAPKATEYKTIVTPAGSVTVSDLTEYLTSTNAGAVLDKQPIVTALNIFLGHYVKKSPNYTTIGGNRSFPVHPTQEQVYDLGAGLRAIRGFFSSVRTATSRILVNINITHAAFYASIELVQSIGLFRAAHGPSPFSLQIFLKRLRVRVTHLKPKINMAGESHPRVKTIYGSPMSMMVRKRRILRESANLVLVPRMLSSGLMLKVRRRARPPLQKHRLPANKR